MIYYDSVYHSSTLFPILKYDISHSNLTILLLNCD